MKYALVIPDGCADEPQAELGGRTPLLAADDLRSLGFALVLYANVALQAAIQAMREVLSALRDTGTVATVLDRLATQDSRQHLVGKPHWDHLDARYRT